MPYFQIPSRRTRQPQGAVRLREQNRWFISPLFSAWFDAAGRFAIPTPGANVSRSAGDNGLGIAFNGSQASGEFSYGAAAAVAARGATQLLVVVSVRFNSVGGNVAAAWDGGGDNSQWILQPTATGELIFGVVDTVTNRYVRKTAAGVIGTAKTHNIVAYWPGGNSVSAYVDGVEVPFTADVLNNGTTNALSTSSGVIWQVGCATDGGQVSARVFDFGVAINSSFSASELRELSTNTWQRYVGDLRRLYFGAGATGVTNYELDAQPATFAVTGTAATLARSWLFDAQPATFQVTGAAATLARGLVVNAGPGSFAVTGVDAGLEKATPGVYTIDAQPGTFAVTGTAATLTYTPVNVYTLDAQPGSFAVTGVAATLTYTPLNVYTLDAQPATFTITGANAQLVYTGASIWTDIAVNTTTWTDLQ